MPPALIAIFTALITHVRWASIVWTLSSRKFRYRCIGAGILILLAFSGCPLILILFAALFGWYITREEK